MTPFTIRTVSVGSAYTLIGELDLAVVADLNQLAQSVCSESDIETVVVDLVAVTFMDAAGIGALVTMRNAAIATGKHLRLDPISARVRRVLHITGLEAAFSIETIDAAAE